MRRTEGTTLLRKVEFELDVGAIGVRTGSDFNKASNAILVRVCDLGLVGHVRVTGDLGGFSGSLGRWLVKGGLRAAGVEVSYSAGHKGGSDGEHECGTHGDDW